MSNVKTVGTFIPAAGRVIEAEAMEKYNVQREDRWNKVGCLKARGEIQCRRNTMSNVKTVGTGFFYFGTGLEGGRNTMSNVKTVGTYVPYLEEKQNDTGEIQCPT